MRVTTYSKIPLGLPERRESKFGCSFFEEWSPVEKEGKNKSGRVALPLLV